MTTLLTHVFALATATLWLAAAPAAEWPPAAVSAAPARPQHIGAYPGHVNHPTKKWIVQMVSEPITYTLQHWACYDKSHAPEAIALEGQIGMMGPDAANWYSNGFFNFSVGAYEGRNFAQRRICALDSGERGMSEFLWELPNAWVRVRFIVVPGQEPLYASIVQVPKGDKVDVLKVWLSCYPSCYAKNGARVGLTPVRAIKAPAKATLDPARESAIIFYDEQNDLGVGSAAGGCGGLVLGDGVARSELNVTRYGSHWELWAKPGGKEMRFAFWSGLHKKNADLIPYLRAQFPIARERLRALDLHARKLRPEYFAKLRREFDQMIKETPSAQPEATQFAATAAQLDALRAQLKTGQVNIKAEDAYLDTIERLTALLWQVRMKWVFAD